jgi:hypothetical protein
MKEFVHTCDMCTWAKAPCLDHMVHS